jgi:hypothetical protein
MYATEFGLSVIPVTYPTTGGGCSCGNPDCLNVAKHPISKLAPNGVKNATNDPFIIGSWFDREPHANIGIATGVKSGLFVVDVDAKSGGLETWAELQDFHGPANTLSSQTGGGGNHYLFKTDGQEIKNSVSKVGPGIDIRAEGGYIVAPPSRHISGDAYEFESDPMTETMASAPDWLVAMLRDSEKPSSNGILPFSGAEVKEGQRNDHLARLGGAARQKGASEAGVSALLLVENGNLDSPLPEGEVAKVAESISRYEPTAGPVPEPLAVKYLDNTEFDVIASHRVADVELVIRAREIRSEKTGVHANVEILYGGRSLGYDTFNIGRNRDRHDLSRRCHARFTDELKKVFALASLETYVDEFCRNLYPESLKNFSPTLVTGNPDIPINMICGDFIIEGGITIMFAQPGHGKSYTAMNMAISVDAGVHDLWNVRQSRVLYLNLERSKESIQRRIGFCNKALNLPPSRPLHVLNTKGKSLAAVADSLRQYIQREGIQVVFLDSISRSGGGSLINDEDTNRTVDLMNDICPTWLAIAHSPRADSSHVYGSVHFEAGADLLVSLTSQINGNLMGVGLKVTKSNDTPKRPLEKFVFEFGSNGLVNARKAKPGEFAEIESQPKPSIKEALVEYLTEHGQISATQAETELGVNRGDASHALNTDPRFQYKGKEGRHSMYGLKAKDAS